MVYDPAARHFIHLRVCGTYGLVARCAFIAVGLASKRNDFVAALDFIDTEVDAQERAFAYDRGDYYSGSAPTLDRQSLRLAAIFGRGDLIDRAITMEEVGIEGVKKPRRPQPEGVTVYEGDTVITEEMQNARHNQGLPEMIAMYEERRLEVIEYKAHIGRFQIIRDVVGKNPGVRQVDLSKHLPGLDNKALARLVDQLEATGFLATATAGSRVRVWPAGHPVAPTAEQLRPARWSFGYDQMTHIPDDFEPLKEWLNPEGCLRNAQRVAELLWTAYADEDSDKRTKPTPLDFVDGMPVFTGVMEGHLIHLDEEGRAMAVWGHIDFDDAVSLLEQCMKEDVENVPASDRRKWLATAPRHTHVERTPHTYTRYNGESKTIWLLKEVPAPGENSVPVTAIARPRTADLEPTANVGRTILWLSP